MSASGATHEAERGGPASEPAAIVLVTTSFPRQGDGSEAAGGFVADLAEELAKTLPVRVVAPGAQSMREMFCPGVEVFRFAAPEKPMSTLRPWIPGELMAIRRVMASGADATRQAVRAGPCEQVLALWALPSGAWARQAALEAGIPYSVWTLGSDIWVLGRLPGVRTWLRRVMCSARYCYSDGLRLAEDTRRIASREVRFLPSTRRISRVRTDELRRSPPYRLLFLGRWHHNKGIDLLLDALSLLGEADWRRIERIEICGGGPMEARVSEAVRVLVAAGRPMVLRGFLDKPAAEAAMLAADWLLIPSRIESIPVVFSDAMKLGLPVVSTPVGDLATLVADAPACGQLSASADAAAFASALASALHSDSSRFSGGVRDRAQRFDLEAIARRLLSGDGEFGRD